MRKIEIFKRRVIFKIEKKEEEEREYDMNPEEILGEKIIYMIILMAMIVLSAKLYLFAPTLTEGDLVTKDIIAPRTLRYNDRIAKEELVSTIISESTKEYIYVQDVEASVLKNVDALYNAILRLRSNKKSYELEPLVAKIEEEALQEYMKKSSRTIRSNREALKLEISNIYKIGLLTGGGLKDTNSTVSSLTTKLGRFEQDLLKNILRPNYVFDEESTRETINEKVFQVEDIFVEIEVGSIIALKGDILTEGQTSLLKAFGIHSFKKNLLMIFSNFVYLLVVSIIFYSVAKTFLKEEILKKNLFRSTLLILIVVFLTYRFTSTTLTYLLPIDAVFFLLGILINRKYAVAVSSFILIFGLPLVNFDLVYYIANTITFFLGLYLLETVKNRTSLINAGVKIGFVKMLIVMFLGFILGDEVFSTILSGGAVLLSGVFAGMLTIALLPYFEKTFNVLTIFKLLELGDLSHPLLRELSVNTPGTFHHSMMVATLSENAAEAIGANAIFARVAAYYHDIGKLKRPNFYVENQRGEENPHNTLTPTMSNLIITSHTKDGVEMAKEHGIPKEIRDVMIEHQGTTLLAYFYNKAKQHDPTMQETDFRYSGPKPRTKESAIIMLADSIEAAVRSLDEKTPITIEKMIRKIISGKIEDNQLSEADLTFKEIEVIIKNFTGVLMGIHHIRLKYPGQNS